MEKRSILDTDRMEKLFFKIRKADRITHLHWELLSSILILSKRCRLVERMVDSKWWTPRQKRQESEDTKEFHMLVYNTNELRVN